MRNSEDALRRRYGTFYEAVKIDSEIKTHNRLLKLDDGIAYVIVQNVAGFGAVEGRSVKRG